MKRVPKLTASPRTIKFPEVEDNAVMSAVFRAFLKAAIEVLFEFLIDKHYIEVVTVETKGNGIFHRYYKVAEKNISKK